MNGAESLVNTLVDQGVDICFANPGTSEMHFLAALENPRMRSVLCLFEGVATGAADGYSRMAGKPAAVLLHLGPGLGNGLANMHNAKRAKSPMVVIVGGHATYHNRYDAPLQSDIEGIARTMSEWVHTSGHQRDIGRDAARAVQVARSTPGKVVTLVLPADVSWSEGGVVGVRREPAPVLNVDKAVIEAAAATLQAGEKTVLLIGGAAMRERGMLAAKRIAQATGATVLATGSNRSERGAGLPVFSRVAYLGEQAVAQMAGTQNLILAGALISIALNALLFAAIGPAQSWARARSAWARKLDLRDDPLAALPMSTDRKLLSDQVVLVGYGRVGRHIAATLDRAHVHYVVADSNREVVEALRKRGKAAVTGDASDPIVLVQAHITKAAMLVVTTPDPVSSRKMVDIARKLNPGIEAVLRSETEDGATLLRKEKLGEVFVAEEELATSMARHVAGRLTKRTAH